MDQLQGIRLFIRVVEAGSFSKAATDLGVTQPTATKHVAELERRLGSRLFHRSTRGVTPTEIGALYYDKCRVIARELEEADNLAALMQSRLRGTLRISTSVAFGRRVMVPLVLRFMQQHPELQIDLSFDDRYVNLIEQGIDVAIRMGRLADSALGARHLGANPWVLVASPTYLARRGVPATPEDLANHDALTYSTVQGDEIWHLERAGEPPRRVPVKGPMRSNNLSALLAAARADLGLAVLPWYVAHDSVKAGSVQPVLTEWTLPSQEIHAVFSSPRLVPTKVSTFVTWLEGEFPEAWWSRPK
jgi:DNA-binding transcriptional LysR family regulator